MNKEQEMIPYDYVWHAPQWAPVVATLSKASVDAYNRYTEDYNKETKQDVKELILDQRHRYLNLCFDEFKEQLNEFHKPMIPKFTRLIPGTEEIPGKLICIGKDAKSLTVGDLASEKKYFAENYCKVWDDHKSTEKERAVALILYENFANLIEGLPSDVRDKFHKHERDMSRMTFATPLVIHEAAKLFHVQSPEQQKITLVERLKKDAEIAAENAPVEDKPITHIKGVSVSTITHVLSEPGSQIARTMYGPETAKKLSDFLTVTESPTTIRYLGHMDGELVSSIVITKKKFSNNGRDRISMAFTHPDYDRDETQSRLLKCVGKDFKGKLPIVQDYENMGLKFPTSKKTALTA